MLIDREIRAAIDSGDLQVEPNDGLDSRIQPASLDVRLGETFAVLNRRDCALIDPKLDQREHWVMQQVSPDSFFTIHPHELVLATTAEKVGLAADLLARVEGKSSLGRLGVLVHATAGFIDPGWPLAQITLEISTVIDVPVKLYPGMPIGQLAFERVEPVTEGYSGKYVGQHSPAPSQFFRNWTGSRWA